MKADTFFKTSKVELFVPYNRICSGGNGSAVISLLDKNEGR